MKALLVAAAVLVLGAAVVGTTRGVERDRSVAAHTALFDELPSFPGSRVVSMRSSPYRDGETRWSPVLGYATLAIVELPAGTPPKDVVAFYEHELWPEWTLADKLTEPPFAAGPILRFRRGSAEVGINLESWRGAILEVHVDHAVAR